MKVSDKGLAPIKEFELVVPTTLPPLEHQEVL